MSSVEITVQHFNKSSSQAEKKKTVWEDIQIVFHLIALGVGGGVTNTPKQRFF